MAIFAVLMTPRMIRIISLLSLIGVINNGITLVLGAEVKGATRWITIGLSLQPSEFAKPFFAVVCAWLLSLWREGEDFAGWIWATTLAALIVAILVLQPNWHDICDGHDMGLSDVPCRHALIACHDCGGTGACGPHNCLL